MTPDVISILVALLAVVIAAYAIYRSGQQPTIENTSAALGVAQSRASEIVEIVQAGVFAAEQLKSTGKLPDNNAAFNYALRHAHKFLPDLDRETLTTFIESSVLVAKQMTGDKPGDGPWEIGRDES